MNSLTINFNVIGNDPYTVTVDPEGGTPPYKYVWSNGDTLQTGLNLTQGIYEVTVADSDECMATGFVELFEESDSTEENLLEIIATITIKQRCTQLVW